MSEEETGLNAEGRQARSLRDILGIAAIVFLAGASFGFFVRSPNFAVREAQAAQEVQITDIKTRLAKHDSILAAQAQVLAAQADQLDAISSDQKLTLCFVRALINGNAKPGCGLEGHAR